MDLYFAGSSHNQASAWINELQQNRLFSQELNRPEIAKMIELRKAGTYQGKILIDSGAFTAHTKGITVDVDEYIQYLNSISEWVDVFVQVDSIPGQFGKPKTDEQLKQAPADSWDNYLYMRPKLNQPEKLIPVYHQGEDTKWLVNMLEWTDDRGNHIPYIGISPANDKSQKEKNAFIDMCFDIIRRSSNPNVKTHAFGMTNLETLTRYPITSADSTSWALTAVNGGIMTPFGVVGMSAQSKNSNALKGKPPAIQQQIREYIKSRGFDMDDLIEAPTEVVIQRIQAKCEIDTELCRAILEGRAKASTTAIRDIIKFEKGRSISGKYDHKAYLERIHWDIVYLAEWSKNFEYKPHTMRRGNLLRGRR